MNKKIFVAIVLIITAACVLLFNFFYINAENAAITKLKDEETINAEQAAGGIEDFFATWTQTLTSMSQISDIINNDPAGQQDMDLFYEANRAQIEAITRMDATGTIIYNYPQSSSIGQNISGQSQIQELLQTHKPVISDVLMSIEGFNAIAMHVPVFNGSEFAGSIGILINFQSITSRYLDVIKIDQTGNAWVISKDGTILYSSNPGITGNTVFSIAKDSPSLAAIVNNMAQGNQGAATYYIDATGSNNAGQISQYAVFMPVTLGNTFWSIAVDEDKKDVLSGLEAFRNELVAVIGGLFICGIVFSILGSRAWLIVAEEEKRKQAEKKLQITEQIAEKFSTLFHSAPLAMSLTATYEGVLYDVNPAWSELTGFKEREAVVGKSIEELGIVSSAEPRERIQKEFEQRGSVRNAEETILTKGGDRTVLINLDWVEIGGRSFVLSSMQDITARKKAEDELKLRTAELEASNKELEAFSYSVSHDLRAPLRSITGFSTVLLEDYSEELDKEGKSYLKRISDAGELMGQLMDDLLKLSRVTRSDLNIQRLDLSDMARKIVDELHKDEPGRKVKVTIAPNMSANGDKNLINLVLQNLLDNAWKYSSKTSEPRIEMGIVEHQRKTGLFCS